MKKINDNSNHTPVMKQYWDAKAAYPDSIMLFRMGDFYETFDKDATITSGILGIALTKRSNGKASDVPLAGFPYHSLEQHVYKLLKSGHKVAICEQVEDPKVSKGIVKREVVEVLTPGLAINDKFLDKLDNNYLASLYIMDSQFSVSLIDNSTGELLTGIFAKDDCIDFLTKYSIPEIVISDSCIKKINQTTFFEKYKISTIPDWEIEISNCKDRIKNIYGLHSLKGLGLKNNELSLKSCGILFAYLEINLCHSKGHIDFPKLINNNDYLSIDSFTIKNLEIFNSLSDYSTEGTLIDVIDNTISSIGSRLLKSWIRRPLIDKSDINYRLDIVSAFINKSSIMYEIRNILKYISDIYRIIGRISTGKSNPRELYNLAVSLSQSSLVTDLTKKINNKEINNLSNEFMNSSQIEELIFSAVSSESTINMKNGGYIKDGYNSDLDHYRELAHSSKEILAKMQSDIQDETGISSLKIGYNKIFGYYIDVTKTNISKVPDYFIRRQTLTNSERYITEELKLYEEKIINAESKSLELEYNIFIDIVSVLVDNIKLIKNNATIFAELDVLTNFAFTAITNRYIRPKLKNTKNININGSRHPVIEKLLPAGDKFIPNDVILSPQRQFGFITGPNMAGKSTYLRQIGLSVIMHQIGSFIPANYAEMSIIDKLFTRVGASDNLAAGESTFFVEMIETANIINNISDNSLVLLDEIGRGTSTQDGLSIAWSVSEYLHNIKLAPLTLFATHYHELVELGENLTNGFNLTVTVKEYNDKVLFLRKIIDGSSDRSYGIHVADMAGIPKSIINRSNKILHSLNTNIKSDDIITDQTDNNIHKQESTIRDMIIALDLDNMTPIEAISILSKLKNITND